MIGENVLGQNHIKEYLVKAVETGLISHAYIIEGNKGTGKFELAKEFAKALQCESPVGGCYCGNCPSCKKVDSGNHPDIKYVEREKATLGVNIIRDEINGDVEILPYSSKHKIYIIKECETMTVEAQNALLKTIEEPPEYAVFMLLTSNINTFLPTIISRCTILNMRPVGDDAVVNALRMELGASEYDARLTAAYAGGNIGKARESYSSEEFKEIKNLVLKVMANVKMARMLDLKNYTEELNKWEEEFGTIIELMNLWFRDILIYKSTEDKSRIVFAEYGEQIMEFAQSIPYDRLSFIFKAIDDAKSRKSHNVNPKRNIEMLLLQIKQSC